MAEKNKTTLKTQFETGDSATEASFIDLIDSKLNLADTSTQTVAGPVGFSNAISVTDVSGPSVSTSGASHAMVSASAGAFDSLTVGGSEVLAAGLGASGSLTITATAATSIGSINNFENIEGTYQANDHMVQVSAVSDGTLKYVGTTQKSFHVAAHISTQAASNNQLVAFKLAINDEEINSTEITRLAGTGADTAAMSVGCVLSANPSARFNVKAGNHTSTANIEVHKITFLMTQV